MLNKRNISVLINNLVNKKCLTQVEANEILSREYVDFLSLEATLDLDYSIDPSAININQLTNMEEYYVQ